MNNKLYVGGLSYSVTDQELSELFGQYGNVESASVVKDRDTNNSRGFGFVEMSTQEEAEKAIKGLDGTDHQGRALKVNMAKPRTDRPRGGESRYRGQRY
ncbi:MAG: RNA-binding protein [Spirochaetales bacterium]|nr:RNA-binding protein [Spirochaetales bacterium]